PGDVLSCEISASWWGYPGQLLRTFTVGAEASPLHRALHETADAAFAAVAARVAPGTTGADLAQAARLVEDAGFTTCDDVVHGYVGGYLPPVVPGAGRPAAHGSFALEAGMTVVVQPNVVSRDGRAGVQTGELLLVTDNGHQRLHRFPPGLGTLAG
ncbi:MAG: M24 family metallopeptidase, partial [Acidimicrobiales bacterium]